ncbi:MAG TPA: multifunctional oxoglutarate decarboxylase/oxoglutarate dehydrogenase thiamine pyrophosphate-binding subunit/dihydrolipoyllysine-residue succinyltransferase subunit [Actinomycetota bacterium]|nr:multifunctional oxoglutarate decarboxylase/oxoglutarate dehydrogenase thiamine pyrophosphate-binding subunit/dihydrolipoyllysine-residue succinyltransferase subunit [Actinomycetota bacterium]
MADVDRSQVGPNAWLIEEMFKKFQDNPRSVSEAWQEFFHDYTSTRDLTGANGAGVERPAAGAKAPAEAAAEPAAEPPTESSGAPDNLQPLTGADSVIAQRMEESLSVPTATSVRVVPAKLLEVNRSILNNHLARTQGGKISFTHLIGWAVIKAAAAMPGMRVTYREIDGKPHVEKHEHVNLGLAVDLKRPDGGRTLVVPNIKDAETLDFAQFIAKYEDMISRSQSRKLTGDDFAGTNVTITNPGMIGTVQSVPRLMAGQAVIVGVGTIAYPAEYMASDPQTLAEIGVGKVVTLTSTYDHRVIQGAESGEFLRKIQDFILGEEGFYEELFEAMGVPYVPVRWRRDVNPDAESLEAEEKQARVLQLINLYRVRGHLIADLDPLDAKPPKMHPELDPAHHGLTIWDLDRKFATGGLAGKPKMTLGEILGVLRDAYCRTGTVEYMHISDPEQKAWIQERVEVPAPAFAKDEQKRILRKLNEAEAFEAFLQKKYVGHKRFSLEGAESVIPMLDAVLERSVEDGLDEVVIGMSHRGRLNVLANIIGKSYAQIFREFEGDIDPESAQGSGDVKYHIGASGVHTSDLGEIPVSVVANPSHLESVDPVVEGMVRAKQDVLDQRERYPVLSVLLHGDAAFAGQGVVAETLNLSALSGYSTGGTIHIIVNNQLGFTTGSDYGRSSTYATDVAKMVQAPILHVNGDDPEACVRAARLAFDFRSTFTKDVVVDMWCYRKWGHNEADEPAFTQPLMFARITQKRSVRKLYTEVLVNRSDFTIEEAEEALEEFRANLQVAFDQTKSKSEQGKTGKFLEEQKNPTFSTAVDRAVLDAVVSAITKVPPGFNIHPKLEKWLAERAQALDSGGADWSLGEALALGSLLLEGRTVRLSGQDTRRGTFSQRHSALVDQKTGEEFVPLKTLEKDGGKFFAYDSLLSEFAALGFEYGYSVSRADALVIWEAQFGDFANGAQVIIDQFISAGQDKWAQKSGLVMLLPHGYEGQGPEHSSARLERFLQLAAEDNSTVAMPSTPAQYFHLLRRQAALGERRRPLIVMTPKSFLRLPAARSVASEFAEGSFQPVLATPGGTGAAKLLFCSGKIYYDLLVRMEKEESKDTNLVRIEQLYPFPASEVAEVLKSHPQAKARWVQEEPENMGAWGYIQYAFAKQLGVHLPGVFRTESASPAAGSYSAHQGEQEALLNQAFGPIE